jgi:hypothetical protein
MNNLDIVLALFTTPNHQWRSQGLLREGGGDKLSAEGANNLGGLGPCFPGKILKFRAMKRHFVPLG